MSLMYLDWGQPAGYRAVQEEIQNQFAWGRKELSVQMGVPISGAARDAGSTPTTVLRPGLVLGQITSSKLWKQYDPTATDGSQIARGILGGTALRVTDMDGNNRTMQGAVIVGGLVLASRVYGLDALARSHFFGRVTFDDDVVGNRFVFPVTAAKTADYTVVAADNGTIFTNRGATGSVTFTLPTITRGMQFRFYAEADQNIVVAAAVGDTLVVHHDIAADSVTIAGGTNGRRIGASLEVVCNDNATKWLVIPSGWLTADTAGQSTFSLAT